MQHYQQAKEAMTEIWSLYISLDGKEKGQAYRTMQELTHLMSMLEKEKAREGAATPAQANTPNA